MNKMHAHPDPRVRYLAHRETQPIDSWARDLSLVLGSIAFLLLIAAVAVLLNPVSA